MAFYTLLNFPVSCLLSILHDYELIYNDFLHIDVFSKIYASFLFYAITNY